MALVSSLSNMIRAARNTKPLPNLPYSIALESLSDIAKAERAEDLSAVRQFNRDVKAWGDESVSALRRSVHSLISRDVVLSDSIKSKVYFDRRYTREANRVGFSFAREGIFIHHGARRGRGGYIGSSWLDKHGTRKFRDPESAGKMQGGIKWFDPVMERRIPQLADIVANYSADIQVNATAIYIEK